MVKINYIKELYLYRSTSPNIEFFFNNKLFKRVFINTSNASDIIAIDCNGNTHCWYSTYHKLMSYRD